MLAIVVSATCAAISSVATKRWGRNTDHISFTALSMAVGSAGLFGLSFTAGEAWAAPAWPEGILPIVYLALAGSVITFVTYWWLLKQVEATTVSYIAMITPIVALFLGVTVGSEEFDALALAGAAVTLAGIYLSTSKRVGAWWRSRGPVAAATDPPNK
jgi:drug/metabolite transporter (DMT)-like permease